MAQSLFESIFNRTTFYETLFFNVKAVLEHPTLEDLEANNKPMYERWKYLSKTKHNYDIDLDYPDIQDPKEHAQFIYEEYAVKYHEFSRIVAITYASVNKDSGTITRDFKKIVSNDEKLVIDTFMDVLYQLSSDGIASSPQFFPILCGHNIIGYDIPLLIKRYVKHYIKKDENKEKPIIENKQLPYILKRCLDTKPWDSGTVIDTTNVWKLNGYDNMPLMLISDFLGLKKRVDVLPLNELSRYYWNNIEEKPNETLEYIALQSATQTNLVLQLMNEMRQF
jgi:hypothetical protein